MFRVLLWFVTFPFRLVWFFLKKFYSTIGGMFSNFIDVKWLAVIALVASIGIGKPIIGIIIIAIVLVVPIIKDCIVDVLDSWPRKQEKARYEEEEEPKTNVLNLNSGVIHRKWGNSASEIQKENRVELTDSQAKRLTGMFEKFRFKKDE